MPAQLITDEGVRFRDLAKSVQETALQSLSSHAYELLTWEELEDALLRDLDELGLGQLTLEAMAPDDGSYGRDAALSGSMTLSELMTTMRDNGAEEYRDCLITPQLVALHAPLVLEIMIATGDSLYVTFSPSRRGYSTAVTLDDEQLLTEYLEWKFFEDLRLDPDDETADEIQHDLQERLNNELDELQSALQAAVDALCRGLHMTFTTSIEYRCGEKCMLDSPWVTDGRFTPDGEFLDFDYA